MIRAKYIGFPGKACDELALAKRIISHAKKEAASTLEEARSNAAQKIIQVRKRAYQTATERAKSSLEREYKTRFHDLEKNFADTIKKAHEDCLDLTLSIAREVIGEELRVNHGSLASRIARSIRGLLDSRSLTVKLPELGSSDVIQALRQELTGLDVACSTSDEIEPGNATLESRSGTVELDWGTHLETIKHKLKTKLNQMNE